MTQKDNQKDNQKYNFVDQFLVIRNDYKDYFHI